MQVKTQFDLFLDKIRPHILDYLSMKGYDTSKPMKCLNPAHKDTHPSMLCSSAGEFGHTVHCLACGFNADIFNLYSILENKSDRGPSWLPEVVLPLAAIFNIPVPMTEISPEEQFCHDLYSAYAKVASLLNHDVTKMGESPRSYVESRQWTEETLTTLDIGTLNYSSLSEILSDEELGKFGLDREDLFSRENLIFLVKDQFSRPIRFYARVPLGEKPKYKSTSTTNLLVDLWRDRGRLYLGHLIDRSSTEVIVVEGQADAVTLWQAGIKNVVALCGVGMLSEAHADGLSLLGISKVTLLFDPDEAGKKSLDGLLQSKDFVKGGSLQYFVTQLPGTADPDQFLREKGVDRLNYLLSQRITAFEYLLGKQDPNGDIEQICSDLIPYIASSKNEVSRERMARELVDFFGGRISLGAIMTDVRRADSLVVSAVMEQQKAIVKAATRQAGENPLESKEILRDAVEKLDELDKKSLLGQSARGSCMARIQSAKSTEEISRAGSFQLLPERLGQFGDILTGGEWMSGRVILIGAVQNMGKSSFLDSMIWEIISVQQNNAIGYILTIDDPLEARIRRIGCNIIGDVDFTQNMIADPRYFVETLGKKDVYEKRETVYAKITELVASNQLLMEDERDGRTVAHLERRVSQLRRDNPEKNIIVGLDNIYDCGDFEGMDMRERMTRIILYVKRIARLQRCTIVATAEYKKGDQSIPGTDSDLAESRKLMYAPHLTVHLFSDKDVKGDEKALLIHRHNGKVLPRVIATIGKNKITEVKGRENQLAFNFFPASSLFFGVPKEQAVKELKQRKEEVANKKPDNAAQEESDEEE